MVSWRSRMAKKLLAKPMKMIILPSSIFTPYPTMKQHRVLLLKWIELSKNAVSASNYIASKRVRKLITTRNVKILNMLRGWSKRSSTIKWVTHGCYWRRQSFIRVILLVVSVRSTISFAIIATM